MTKYWEKEWKTMEQRLKQKKLDSLLKWSYQNKKKTPQEWIADTLKKAGILKKKGA